MNLFSRKCPNCQEEIQYSSKAELKKAQVNNNFCFRCRHLKWNIKEKEFFRKCPKCKKELGYTNKKNRNRAEKLFKLCRSCIAREIQQRDYIIKRHEELYEWRKERYSGKRNPFYGKKHTLETINKIKNRNLAPYKTKKFRKKLSIISSGQNNPMYGKNFYDVWVEKYGENIADEKMNSLRRKRSENSRGKKNPMYGRKPPIGSGNGWGGWYKGWYFRSLRELSYMINVIEKNGKNWVDAEKGEFRIPYIDYNGSARTYSADFFIDGKNLVEIKPEKLMNTPSNVLKKKAAVKFCKTKGWEYKMVDVRILDQNIIIDMYSKKEIMFNRTTKVKMENLICKSAKKKK